jgi:hypothetical protein
MRAAAWVAMALCSVAALAQECPSVRYEPEPVTLQGTVSISVGKHPDGTRQERPILQLENAVTVEPSAQADPVNTREACVSEIQLVANSAALHALLLKTGKATVTVAGTLFHEHTAWHVRPVLMAVKSLQVSKDRRTQ